MKRFARRLQQLGEKAAKVQQVIDAAPGKAARLRQTVLSTAGQVQQLKSEVLSAVTGLRTMDDGGLVDAIPELDAAGPVLAEAGYEIESVELEMGVTQRLIVHLIRVEEVAAARIRGLADLHRDSPVLHAILMAAITAQDLAEGVDGGSFQFAGLTAYVGAAPCVRLVWEPVGLEDEEETPPPVIGEAGSTPAPQPTASSASSASAFGSYGSSSFFEPRAASAAKSTSAQPAAGATTEPAGATPQAKPRSADEAAAPKEDPLARFKKMPDLGRR